MRLLVITETVGPPFRHGAEVFCSQLARRLVRRHQVTLIAARAALPAAHDVVPVDLALTADPEALAALLDERVSVGDYDLVYNLGGLGFGAAVVAALAAGGEPLPLVNHFQALLGPYAASEGLDEEMRLLNDDGQRQLAEAAVLNIFLSHADSAIAVRSGFDLSRAVTCVVPAAVDAAELAAVAELPREPVVPAAAGKPAPLVVLTAGRFSDFAKGGDLVYRAFRYLAAERDDVFLLSIADSERFAEVLAGVPAERFRIEGWLERPAFLRRLAAADVVVLPSRYEAFGLIAVEAMMLGIPVVATAVGGLQEIVQHRRTGLLSEIGDGSHGLYLCLRELAADPALRRRLGEAGRRFARRELDFRRVAGLVDGCLERARLAAQSPSRGAALAS